MLTRTIHVNAPVGRVFDLIKNPIKRPPMLPREEITSIKLATDGVGTKYTFVARMAGIPFAGVSRFVEFVPNRRIVERSDVGEEGIRIWFVEPDGAGTRLTVEGDYWLPFPLMSNLAEAAIRKTFDHAVTTGLSRLAAMVER